MLVSLAFAAASLTGPVPQEPDFDLPAALEEWRARIVWIQREVRRRVLPPPPEVVEEHRELLEREGTGVARLVDQILEDDVLGQSMLERGGAAYYSFYTRDHSYDAAPDLKLSRGSFHSGFAGLDLGAVAPIGSVPLDEVPTGADPMPADLPEATQRIWPHLWAPISREMAQHGSDFRKEWRALAPRDPSGQVGDTFLVRSRNDGSHDLLVAFRIAAKDEVGVTIVWRELRRFTANGPTVPWHEDVDAGVADAPGSLAEELTALSLESLLDRIEIERDEIRGELLGVPEKLQQEFLRAIGPRTSFAQEHGFMRLNRRGRLAAVLGPKVACYYSFQEREHGWSGRVEIGLTSQGRLTGGMGACWMLDLGALEFDQLARAAAGKCPRTDDERIADGWKVLHDMPLQPVDGRDFVPPQKWAQKLVRAGISGDRTEVVGLQGHSLLFRTAHPRHGDRLLLLTILDDDGIGLPIAWRVLKSFPLASRADR